MSVTLEKMRECHISEIAGIERECFSSPWTEAQLYEELSNPSAVFFTALENGSVVGYIGSNTVAGEMYITNVAVSAAHRGKGIGGSLIKAVVAHALKNGVSFISLEVRVSNETAKRLYGRFGFELCGKRKNFYSNPREDAEILTLFLK